MSRGVPPRPGMRAAVRVPATTANLGPGFDALGMALGLGVDVEFEALAPATRGGSIVTLIRGEGQDFLPRDATNMIYACAARLAQHLGRDMPPVSVRVVNRVPLSRGMGSSASAIVGGLVTMNALFGSPADADELLALATEIEGHPDNVAPALFGGLIASSMAEQRVLWVRIQPPTDLKLVLAIPSFPLSTHAARSALPGMLLYADAVFNVSHASLLVAALTQGRYDLLRYAMEDKLHQPYRKKLVPGMDEVFEAAMSAGAHGVALSGAGPSLIAFATGETAAIGDAMRNAWEAHGIECTVLQTVPSREGALPIEPYLHFEEGDA